LKYVRRQGLTPILLLRVLQKKEFERIGGTKLIRTDFRIIASTNRPLEELVEKNAFRKDLYYRLNVIPIHIPPLKERREDIPGLVAGHLRILNEELGTGKKDLSPEAMEVFRRYDWPGNVRELQNILERIVCSVQENTIKPEDIPPFMWEKTADFDGHTALESLQNIMNRFERKVIEKTLIFCGNNKAHAARKLGLHRTALYKKMKKLGIGINEVAEKTQG
jgi:transcriptional regulator with PAS, ATPase and Fis domain